MVSKGWSALKDRAERGPSAAYIKIGDRETARIRFLVRKEDDVVSFKQHYIDGRYRLCEDESEDGSEDCRYCDEDNRPSMNYAFNVIDRKDGKVKVLQLSISHATAILEFLEEYGSISDRDYKISRHGNKSATRYTLVPMKVSKWDAVEIQAYKERYNLEELYDPEVRNPKKEEPQKKKRVSDETTKSKVSSIKSKTQAKAKKPPKDEDEDDDDEEEEPVKKKSSQTKTNKKSKADEDEDEEEEDDDEDEEEEDLEDAEDEDDEDEDEDDEEDDEDEEEDEDDDEDEDEDDEEYDLEDDDE